VTILCVYGGILTAPAPAGPWCAQTWPSAVYCEDFDSYTLSSFYVAWPPDGPCGSPLDWRSSDQYCSSSPRCAFTNTQEGGDFGYSVHTIPDAIRNAFGAAYSSVIGTDLNPLVLELVMNGERFGGRGPYDNSFFTLGSGSAIAPTNWAFSNWCTSCGSPRPRYPIICQQESTVAACPPINTAPHVPVIAVGFLAYLDENPCHCGESFNSPYNVHLSFFDGFKWYKLRSGLFPGSGNFMLRAYENRIKITIKQTTVKVELTTPDTGEYSWCQLTDAYTGPFNSLGAGFHVACELNSTSWMCKTGPTCDVTVGLPLGGEAYYDNIVLHGGIGYSAPGACCFPNTTCAENTYYGDCLTLGGQCGSPGSTCAETACCPPLPADHDMDGDVDMVDFSWLQQCLSGADITPATVACQCADFDHDNDVDAGDVTKFLGCLLGPDVLANPNCLN
jgi:hypothetical protein